MNRAEFDRRMPWVMDLAERLPESAFVLSRRASRRASLGVRTPVRWGGLRRTSPINRHYGYGRGMPIDRWYLRQFMAMCSADFRGRILELQNDEWSAQHATPGSAVDILDMDPMNGGATLVADLGEAGSLPTDTFDCIVLPQTLQYLADPSAALRNLAQSCRSGGTLLITVPSVSKLDPTCGPDGDLWRLTPAGLGALISRTLPDAGFELTGYGNVLAATAFLYGIAAEELSAAELDHVDHEFPMLACARVTL